MVTKEAIYSSVNKSHLKNSLTFQDILTNLRAKVINRGNLPYVTVEKQLQIIKDLCGFPLGRFILERGGANAFWTDYILSYYKYNGHTGLNIEGKPFSSLEFFLLSQSPIVVASQERFHIFQNIIQSALRDNMVLASIPCGIMSDLLTLDYSKISNYKLYGIDYDEESLFLAQKLAKERGITKAIFCKEDAWQLSFYETFDIITSNGLNVYESDRDKVIDLYKSFLKGLRPNGILVIGVLTYPPGEIKDTDWVLDEIPNEVVLMENILHKDISDIKWRNFRSIGELESDFNAAGFEKVVIHYDKHRVFPTIVATKAGY